MADNVKIGAIVLNYNSSEYLGLTLSSLAKAKSRVDMQVIVFDNGSRTEENNRAISVVSSTVFPDNITVEYRSSQRNLGFAGANNVVIKEFLAKEDITHILLLNNDVCVPDYWIDYLTEKNSDIVAPVTNAAGNEQTISIDYCSEMSGQIIDKVNAFSEKRKRCYSGSLAKTSFVTFFCALVKRSVFEDIGLLDERFFPGGYEDNDFCQRALNAGYDIEIARDCFVHHFGSGSFSKIDSSEFEKARDKNKRLYEKKWGGVLCDEHWKLILSCRQDLEFYSFCKDSNECLDLIFVSLRKLEAYYGKTGEELEKLRLLRAKPLRYFWKGVKTRAKRKAQKE